MARRSRSAIVVTRPPVHDPPSLTYLPTNHGAAPAVKKHEALAPLLMNRGIRAPGMSSWTKSSQKWLQFFPKRL